MEKAGHRSCKRLSISLYLLKSEVIFCEIVVDGHELSLWLYVDNNGVCLAIIFKGKEIGNALRNGVAAKPGGLKLFIKSRLVICCPALMKC